MENIDRIKVILNAAGITAEVKPMEDVDEGYEIDGIELVYHKEARKWGVEYWETVRGGHWEPDDVDQVIVSDSHSLIDSVKSVIATLVDKRLTDIGYTIYPLTYEEF